MPSLSMSMGEGNSNVSISSQTVKKSSSVGGSATTSTGKPAVVTSGGVEELGFSVSLTIYFCEGKRETEADLE
jgi:hypothetical protein